MFRVVSAKSVSSDNPSATASVVSDAKVSNVWKDFTNDVSPHNARKSTCKHCSKLITHSNRLARVKCHLNSCPPLLKLMDTIEDHPTWISPTNDTRQRKIDHYVLPKLAEHMQEAAVEKLAMFFYNAGLSFRAVEDPFFQEFISCLQPAFKIPSRKQLSDKLLNNTYDKVKEIVDNTLLEDDVRVCITTDATTNVSNQSIINYMACTPKGTFFLETVNPKESLSGEFIGKDAVRVIGELSASGVCVSGVVTDNCKANKVAWSIIKEQYPNTYIHGCVSHCLNLLLKDIFCASKLNINGTPSYPAGYPFEYLIDFTQKCKDVVTYFTRHTNDRNALIESQQKNGVPQLVQPVETRWGSMLDCFRSIQKSSPLITYVLSDVIKEKNRKRSKTAESFVDTMTNPEFRTNLSKSIEILELINTGIVMFQDDRAPLSSIYNFFVVHLPTRLGDNATMKITLEERKYIRDLVQKRFDFIKGDAMLISYMLDPIYKGADMLPSHQEEVDKLLFDTADTNANTQLYNQHTQWRKTPILPVQKSALESTGGVTPMTRYEYWLEQKYVPQLKEVALNVFAMVATSSSSERCFSVMKFVHSKSRNRMNQKIVRKLLYTKMNASLLREKDSGNNSTNTEVFKKRK